MTLKHRGGLVGRTDHVLVPEADGGEDLGWGEVPRVGVVRYAVEVPPETEILHHRPHCLVQVKQKFAVHLTSDAFLCMKNSRLLFCGRISDNLCRSNMDRGRNTNFVFSGDQAPLLVSRCFLSHFSRTVGSSVSAQLSTSRGYVTGSRIPFCLHKPCNQHILIKAKFPAVYTNDCVVEW